MRTLPFAAALLSVLTLTAHRPLALQDSTGSLAGGRHDQFEVALPPGSEVRALVVAPGGRTVLAGDAYADEVPTTPGAVQAECHRSQFGYCQSPFVMVFSPSGELEYSTFVGGASERPANAIAPGPDGTLWILLGNTDRAPDPVYVGCGPNQPVLARIRPGVAGYERFTCVGGPHALWSAFASNLAVARDGTIWVVGSAGPGAVIPAINAWQPGLAGSQDVFAIRYAAGGQEMLLATYLGGRDSDSPAAMAVAQDGDLIIVGRTQSFDFPAVRPLQAALGSTSPYVADAFITRVDPGGRVLEYSTWLGGAGLDEADSVAVDASGNAYVVGATGSPNFPETRGTCGSRVWPGPYSGFLASVDPAGRLRFSTRIAERPRAVMVHEDGSVDVSGYTCQADFPCAGRVPRLWPSEPFCPYPFYAKTEPFASALLRSTLVPVVTDFHPAVQPPTPALGTGNWVEAVAFDADYLYLAGRTVLWYRPYPESDMLHLATGHYLKKWHIGDSPEREPGRDRR